MMSRSKLDMHLQKITYDVDEAKKQITVKLPQVQTLSKDLTHLASRYTMNRDSMFTTIKLETQKQGITGID